MSKDLLDMVDRIEELENSQTHLEQDGDRNAYRRYSTLKTQFFAETQKRKPTIEPGVVLDLSIEQQYGELKEYIDENVEDLEVEYTEF